MPKSTARSRQEAPVFGTPIVEGVPGSEAWAQQEGKINVEVLQTQVRGEVAAAKQEVETTEKMIDPSFARQAAEARAATQRVVQGVEGAEREFDEEVQAVDKQNINTEVALTPEKLQEGVTDADRAEATLRGETIREYHRVNAEYAEAMKQLQAHGVLFEKQLEALRHEAPSLITEDAFIKARLAYMEARLGTLRKRVLELRKSTLAELQELMSIDQSAGRAIPEAMSAKALELEGKINEDKKSGDERSLGEFQQLEATALHKVQEAFTALNQDHIVSSKESDESAVDEGNIEQELTGAAEQLNQQFYSGREYLLQQEALVQAFEQQLRTLEPSSLAFATTELGLEYAFRSQHVAFKETLMAGRALVSELQDAIDAAPEAEGATLKRALISAEKNLQSFIRGYGESFVTEKGDASIIELRRLQEEARARYNQALEEKIDGPVAKEIGAGQLRLEERMESYNEAVNEAMEIGENVAKKIKALAEPRNDAEWEVRAAALEFFEATQDVFDKRAYDLAKVALNDLEALHRELKAAKDPAAAAVARRMSEVLDDVEGADLKFSQMTLDQLRDEEQRASQMYQKRLAEMQTGEEVILLTKRKNSSAEKSTEEARPTLIELSPAEEVEAQMAEWMQQYADLKTEAAKAEQDSMAIEGLLSRTTKNDSKYELNSALLDFTAAREDVHQKALLEHRSMMLRRLQDAVVDLTGDAAQQMQEQIDRLREELSAWQQAHGSEYEKYLLATSAEELAQKEEEAFVQYEKAQQRNKETAVLAAKAAEAVAKTPEARAEAQAERLAAERAAAERVVERAAEGGLNQATLDAIAAAAGAAAAAALAAQEDRSFTMRFGKFIGAKATAAWEAFPARSVMGKVLSAPLFVGAWFVGKVFDKLFQWGDALFLGKQGKKE